MYLRVKNRKDTCLQLYIYIFVTLCFLRPRICFSCASKLGRARYGRSSMLLSPVCGRTGIMHEFMHALGIWHEQSRDDRDQYVTVMANNIIPG